MEVFKLSYRLYETHFSVKSFATSQGELNIYSFSLPFNPVACARRRVFLFQFLSTPRDACTLLVAARAREAFVEHPSP